MEGEEREGERGGGKRFSNTGGVSFLFPSAEASAPDFFFVAFSFFSLFFTEQKLSLYSHAFSLASALETAPEPKSPRLTASEEACDAKAPSEAFIREEEEKVEEEDEETEVS